MYEPSHFRQDDPLALQALMRAFPLAVLTTFGAERMHVSHVPLEYQAEPDGPGRLIGHLAQANPQAQHYDSSVEAIAVFTGPGAYVSPSAYETKRQTGKVVPTWNYAAVYAFGSLVFLDEAAAKHAIVNTLTNTFESDRAAPWAVSDAPDDYIQSMLAAIRPFEFRITRLTGKWKLSQNRSPADRDGVIATLADGGGDSGAAVVAMMRKLYGG